jgi:hypothetical protein
LALVLTLTLTAWWPLAAAEGAEPEPTFARDVAPILDRWCVACHGPREQHNGLRLDGYAWLMRRGDARPAVLPGDPARSLLVAKIERRHSSRHAAAAPPPRFAGRPRPSVD